MKRFAFIGLVVLAGCTTLPERTEEKAKVDQALSSVEHLSGTPKVIVSDKPYVDPKPIYRKVEKHQWLREIKDISITERPGAGAIPLKEIVRQLKAEGVNVSSNLPLEKYPYSGFEINNTDAFTALEIITSSIGIDFQVFDGEGRSSQYVELLPMQTSSYDLDVPDKQVKFEVTDNAFAGSSLTLGQGQGGGQGQGQQNQGQNSEQGSEEKTKVSYEGDFYTSLRTELNDMLVRLIPKAEVEGQSAAMGAPGVAGSALYQEVVVGRVSINANTGKVTVQAPKHMREEIVDYLEALDRELNTNIEVEGRIVVETRNGEQKKGLDVSSLVEFGDKYNLVVNNDVYNQTTISMPGDSGALNVAADGALGSLLGISADDGLLQVFNAYVESESTITTVLEPRVTTSSGKPGVFSKSRPFYINNVSGSASQGENGTTSSTSNSIQSIEFGASMRVLPTYNVNRDTVRVQVDLTHVVQNGFQELEQFVQTETGTERTVTRIPSPERISVQGEVVANNGSLIILGGQTIEKVEQSSKGVPKARDSYVGGLFGSSTENVNRNKYYLVLFVKATTFEEALIKAREGA